MLIWVAMMLFYFHDVIEMAHDPEMIQDLEPHENHSDYWWKHDLQRNMMARKPVYENIIL